MAEGTKTEGGEAATQPKPKRARAARRPAAPAAPAAALAGEPAALTPLKADRDFHLGSTEYKAGATIPVDVVAGLGERGVRRLKRQGLAGPA